MRDACPHDTQNWKSRDLYLEVHSQVRSSGLAGCHQTKTETNMSETNPQHSTIKYTTSAPYPETTSFSIAHYQPTRRTTHPWSNCPGLSRTSPTQNNVTQYPSYHQIQTHKHLQHQPKLHTPTQEKTKPRNLTNPKKLQPPAHTKLPHNLNSPETVSHHLHLATPLHNHTASKKNIAPTP